MIKLPNNGWEISMSESKAFVDVDQRQYSYFSALWKSFYSKSLYIDIVKRWKGFGFVYLMIMVMVFSAPVSLVIVKQALTNLDENIIQPITQLPQFKVTDGKVDFDHPMPYVINNQRTGKPALIVDTTGQIKSLNAKGMGSVSTLITSDTLYVRSFANELNKQKLGKIGVTEVFDGKHFVESIPVNKMRWVFKLSVYPIVACILFGVLIVMLMMFAALSQIMASTVMHFQMRYKQATRVAFVAATPFIVVTGVCYALFKYNNWVGIIQFLVLLGYFIFAVRVNKKVAKQLVHT